MKYTILTQASQLDYDAMGGKGSPEQPAWAPEDFAALGAFMEAFNTRLAESGGWSRRGRSRRPCTPGGSSSRAVGR